MAVQEKNQEHDDGYGQVAASGPVWSAEDDARAKSEGWLLSERDDGTYQVQAYDEALEEVFPTDIYALGHVAEAASARNHCPDRGFYQRALRLHGERVLKCQNQSA